MLMLPASVRVWLTAGPVDLRRGHDGLSALVHQRWGEALYAGHLFVFLGRRLDRCKVLYWDHGGLVLVYKRLEKGRFRLPAVAAGAAEVEMDGTALAMLLDGIDVKRVVRPSRWTPKTAPVSVPAP